MSTTSVTAAAASLSASILKRERTNWLIHKLYIRREFPACLAAVDEQLRECDGQAEYALYVKGLIRRMEGQIQDSLALFQQAALINPKNIRNLKQVARSLFLMARHAQSLEVYEEVSKLMEPDWELLHQMGLCNYHLKRFDKAEDLFVRANLVQRHDATFVQLAKVFTETNRFEQAIETYHEALEFSPENPELLTQLGLIHLRLGHNEKAFECLGTALTYDSSNPKTILAAGSIIQDHGDVDVALNKYRLAAPRLANSAQLWNNIGMCFFTKQNLVAAAACLMRALYLSPFEWIISYNLGLVYLHTSQYASAFHHLSAAINAKSDFAPAYMYLGIALDSLNDFENACSAFERAIEMDSDTAIEANYAAVLLMHGKKQEAAAHLASFERLFANLSDEQKRALDPSVLELRGLLTTQLGPPAV